MADRHDLRDRCIALCAELGLAEPGEVGAVEPLKGGVSADIARVELPARTICAKFALPSLRVAAQWDAPLSRNRAEYDWLAAAGSIVPSSVPELLGHSPTLHGFAMDYLEAPGTYVWKAALLAGAGRNGEAAAVADVLGRIHGASGRPGFDMAPFQNQRNFWSLRIEPYLVHLAGRHRDLAAPLEAIVEELGGHESVLVHGDVSPKNILFHHGAPVLLDAECATIGDPAFDVAFCLNHLLLKSIHMPHDAARLHGEVSAFWSSYRAHVDWEDEAGLEVRVARLLPALMLARVDGKSPVEYLSDAEAARVRALAIPLIRRPPARIEAVAAHIDERGVPDA